MSLNPTKIPWVRNHKGGPGYTWNPITGCLNHVNGMCKGGNFHCYAHGLAHGRLKDHYLANNIISAPRDSGLKDASPYDDPFWPRFWIDRALPITTKDKPKGIFACSMGELFGDWIPKKWQELVFNQINRCPYHRFYLLTKQYRKLQKWSPFPDNCWVGATVTNEITGLIAWDAMRYITAPLKYLSIEPLLGQLTISSNNLLAAGIGWIIIGCQTKPTKYPKLEWVEWIAIRAAKVGIPVFYKNELDDFLPQDSLYRFGGGDLRQEMPEIKE